MSDIVIQVDNLGKQYFIRHQNKERYTSLRDVITHKAASIGRRMFHPFNRPQSDPNCERFWALRDVNFEVKQGEVIGIIGRNGAGKSTLLKILSRITEPTTGRVRTKGRVASLLEVGTGFHPELTGKENIFLNGAILGMTKAEIKSKLEEILAFCEVGKFIDTPVKRYSSGMKVRLAFSVAAHLEPEILLVDEVLAVGDAAFQKKCLGKMGDVVKQGRTVMFVSHNMGAVASLCERTILLKSGRISISGTTRKVIDAYVTEALGNRSSEDADRAFPERQDRPAWIRSIRMSNSRGELSLAHDILDPIRIDLSFAVNKQMPNLFIASTVRTLTGQTVYTTNEMDWINYSGPRKLGVFPKEPGNYKASVVLPAPLLNAGTYELRCVLGSPNAGRIDTQDGLYFEVSDSGGSFASFPFKRNGVVVLPLQWLVNKL